MGLRISVLKDPPSDIKSILPVLSFKLSFYGPVKMIFIRTQMEICNEKLYGYMLGQLISIYGYIFSLPRLKSKGEA